MAAQVAAAILDPKAPQECMQPGVKVGAGLCVVVGEWKGGSSGSTGGRRHPRPQGAAGVHAARRQGGGGSGHFALPLHRAELLKFPAGPAAHTERGKTQRSTNHRGTQAHLTLIAPSSLPPPHIPSHTQEAAETLRLSEYYVLSPSQRLAVLRTLLDLALNSDVFREYVGSKAELMCGGRPKGGFNLLPADPDEDFDVETARQYIAPHLTVPDAQEPFTWLRWLEGCRCGSAAAVHARKP